MVIIVGLQPCPLNDITSLGVNGLGTFGGVGFKDQYQSPYSSINLRMWQVSVCGEGGEFAQSDRS